jgi:hypothetical protein
VIKVSAWAFTACKDAGGPFHPNSFTRFIRNKHHIRTWLVTSDRPGAEGDRREAYAVPSELREVFDVVLEDIQARYADVCERRTKREERMKKLLTQPTATPRKAKTPTQQPLPLVIEGPTAESLRRLNESMQALTEITKQSLAALERLAKVANHNNG